jgi:integrase/recombinase XerD
MLSVYRRHKSDCKHADDRVSKKCRCALWCDGVVEGRHIRKSLKTRNLERAHEIARDIEGGKKPEAELMTFKTATERFLNDMIAQNRADDTIRKYKLLFSKLSDCGHTLVDFTFDVLLAFRSTWTESPATKGKKLDRLKAFFRFAHDAGWIPQNPAKGIKAGVVRSTLVKPFTKEEQKILLSKPQTRQLRCFVHVLYHSALRISDAAMLRPEDFDGNRIRRVNKKNNETVLIPIPPDLKAELDRIPLSGGYYFLIGESERVFTQTDAWRDVLAEMFKKEIPGFHPHRFRHTAAVNWLALGLTLEEVAALLGNSVKVVEKHYASFCGARQDVLEQKLQSQKTWRTPLVRVK